MRIYKTQAGRWAGTQAEAGKGFTQIEVPTDKPGLLVWLNENAADDPPIIQEERRVEGFQIPPEPRAELDDTKARKAELIAKGKDVEALGEWIFEAEIWELERIFGMLATRLGEMRKGGRI